MRSYLFLLFYLWTSISFAQTLNGVINLQNSQGRQVSGAEISVSLVDQTLQTRSDQNGKFSIDLTGKVLGQQISLSIKKSGLEVINLEDLWLNSETIPEMTSPIIIQMAPLGTKQKLTEKYYGLAASVLEASSTDSLIKTKLSPNELEELKRIAYDQLNVIAQRLAEIDTSQASEMAKTAFKAFENQQISAALAAMEDAKMAAALKNASNGSVRGKDVTTQSPKKQSIDNYLLKARLSVLNLRIKDAQAYYTHALYADQDDFAKIAEFTRLLIAVNEEEKAAALCKKGFSVVRNDAQTVVILGLQARVQRGKKSFSDAIQTLEEAHKIYSSLKADLPQIYKDDVAKGITDLGHLHYNAGNFELALTAFNHAKKLYSDLIISLPQRYHKAIAQVYTDLGAASQKIGDRSQSTEAYVQLVNWQKKALDNGNPESQVDYLQSRRLLANNHLYFGDFEQALPLFEELVKDERISSPLERGKNFTSLATAQFLLQKTQTAFASSEQAGSILKADYPKSVEQANAYAEALNMQAEYYLRKYQFDKAVEIYNQLGPVLGSIQQQSSTKEHLVIAKSFAGMASAYLGQFDFQRSEKAFQVALAMINSLNEAKKGAYVAEKAQILNQYIRLHEVRNDQLATRKTLAEAFTFYPTDNQNLSFQFQKSICQTYIHQANQKILENNVSEALISLTNGEKFLGKGDAWTPLRASFLITKGEVMMLQDDTESSRTMIQDAINLLTPLAVSKISAYQILLLNAYLAHAKVFINATQYTTAQARLEASESLLKELETSNLSSKGIFQYQLNQVWADFFTKREEYGKAEEKLFAVIDFLEKEENKRYRPILAATYYQLSLLYHHTQAKKESLDAFQKAENLQQEGQSNISPIVLAEMYNNFANSLKSWEQYDEAIGIFQRAAEAYESMDAGAIKADKKEILADIYTNMAWCSIFLQELGHAEAYTDAALVQKTEYVPAQLMQAHIWTLNSRFFDAKKVYSKLANKTFKGKRTRDICFENLNSLEEAGISNSNFSKVRELF